MTNLNYAVLYAIDPIETKRVSKTETRNQDNVKVDFANTERLKKEN